MLGFNTAQQESPTYEPDVSDDVVAVEMMLQFIYFGRYRVPTNPYGYIPVIDITKSKTSSGENRSEAATDYASGRNDINGDSVSPMVVESMASSSQPSSESELSSGNYGSSMACGHLELHAKVYALGDKYGMPMLMSQALINFRQEARTLEWHEEAFCTTISTVHSFVRKGDTTLNQTLAQVLHERAVQGLRSTKIDDYVCDSPELAVELWKLSVKSDAKSGPGCRRCGTVFVKKCKNLSSDGKQYPSSCERRFAACDCKEKEYCTPCAMNLPSSTPASKKRKKSRNET